MSARALLAAFLVAAVVGAGLYALLRPEPAPAPAFEAPPAAAPPSPTGRVPTMLMGTLVVRVRAADGSPLPREARGGYRSGVDPRLRPLSAEGVVRFSDIPLVEPGPTRLEALAEAPGFFPASKEVLLSRDQQNETNLVLTRVP